MSRPLRNYLLAVFFASSLTSTALSWSFGSSGGAGHRLRCRIASSTGVPVRRFMAERVEDGDDDDVAGDENVVGTARHSGYNVLGSELTCCCSDVGGSGIGTGFYRNGLCATGDMDMGRHTVCVQVNAEFLEYSKSVGNDLSTPMPQYSFPGLNDGDVWCLCAQRWAQAYNAGKAPRLFLLATHEKTLDYVPLDVLRIFAIDAAEANAVNDRLNLQRRLLDGMMSRGVRDDGDSFQ